MNPPLIGITMGDVAGIGPEITVKALLDDTLSACCRVVVLGDRAALRKAQERLGVHLDMVEVPEAGRIARTPGNALFVAVTQQVGEEVPLGRVSKQAGKAAGAYIETAVQLALQGILDGIATAPINKEALRLAGYPYPGHTEFLMHLTRTHHAVMMLAGEWLRVSLVTIHCPLREVPDLLSSEAVMRTVWITYQGLRIDFGLDRPRIAVAGLNPHAGEGGLFGDEEEEIIRPALRALEKQGIHAQGPLPPDTVFVHAREGRYDAVVCMYHDQGLIPLKLLHFSDGVNITLGLPIVRTSVDHGTAYDIAGTGQADPRSLIQAVKTAALMAQNRKKAEHTPHGAG